MALPVLEDNADEAYHSPQRSTKRTVEKEGTVSRGDETSREGCLGERPLARRDIDVKFGKLLDGRRKLRVTFLSWERNPRRSDEPLHSAASPLFFW